MDALLCLATYSLTSPAFPALPPADQATLATFLRACPPTTESFSALVGLFTVPPTPDPASPFDFPLALSRSPSEESTPTPTAAPAPRLTQTEAVNVLRRYARELRTHGLFLLEASLWGNALRKVEDVLLTGGNTGAANPFASLPRRGGEAGDDLHGLREELVGRVERAEARCFDAGAAGAAVGANAVASVPLTGEWVWQEMVGSWVQKSPSAAERAPKKRKLALERELTVRPLPAAELNAPRRTRSQAQKPPRQNQRQGKRQSMPTPSVQPTASWSGASSLTARSRQTTPTLVATPHREDDEETLASSEFEDFPGLSQSKKRARQSASSGKYETESRPNSEAEHASSAGEEEEEQVLPVTMQRTTSRDAQLRARAPRRTSTSSTEGLEVEVKYAPESRPRPKARGPLKQAIPRRGTPSKQPAPAPALVREDSDDEFESMLPNPEDLSSDDLNLFAYPSSPIRVAEPRRRTTLAC